MLKSERACSFLRDEDTPDAMSGFQVVKTGV